MKLKALAVLSFPAGTSLGLSKAQAALRAHALQPDPERKGWYITTLPTQFKIGEVLHFDGDMPKSMIEDIDPQGNAADKAAADKAAAESANGGLLG